MNSLQSCQQTRNGTPVMQLIIWLAMLSLFSIIPGETLAADIAGGSRTYMRYGESTSGDKLLPLYEFLDFTVQDLGKEAISIHVGGWLGYDLQDDSFGVNKDKGSDLQYGYVSYRTKERNAVVNLGRVMVFEGVAAERVDGVYARTDIKGGFGVAAFGGAPVETGTDLPGNSIIYGARLSHQNVGLYTIGLSYLKEEKNSATFREAEGLDLWLRPVNKVEIMGSSSYNVETTGWMEHAYYLMLGPFEKIRFNTEASWINYADYFAAATANVFKFTPGGPIDPNEKVKILGEEIFFAIDANWAVSFDIKKYNYDIAGSAMYSGAKVTYVLPKSYNAGLSVHTMDGDTDRNKYDEYRIYASKKLAKIDVAVDLLDVKYKEPINTVTNAYAASLSAVYALTQKLKLGADLTYSKNPDFDKDVRIFARMVYSFDVVSGSRKPAAGQEKERAISEPVPAAVMPALGQPAPKAEPAPAPPAAAAPEKVVPSAPVEPAGAPAEQGKPKEGN